MFEGSGTRILDMVYGNDGRRKNINRRSNLSTTQYSFTDGLHLDSFTQDFAGTANDVTNTFQYNPANQITRFAVANGNTQYMYRGDNNRTGAYQPNHLNQYVKVNGQPLGYDLNQNLTNDGTQTYQYDDENRLISTSGAVTASFVYDPRGRLFQSTINGVVTQYLYDGDKLIAEYDGTGTLTRRYVHGNGVDEPLLQYNSATLGTAAWRYLHTDQQGSVIAQSDVNGNVISGTVMAYDTFGITSNPSASRFAYTGQIQFPELGVYYYKARFYSPKLGRFLQTDPIGYKDQMALYSYVGNDPINKTDPTGQQSDEALNHCGCKDRPQLLPTLIKIVKTVISGSQGNSSKSESSEPKDNLPETDATTAEEPKQNQLPESSSGTRAGSDNKPRSDLPRDPRTGDYLPHADAEGPHTTLGTREGSDGEPYTQGASFDAEGNFTGRTDVTNHGRKDHGSPHFHPAKGPNSVGGPEDITD